MIAYKTEKIDNAICFFAGEVYKRTQRYLPQTLLYKLLAYLDFYSIEKFGKPVLELKYFACDKGPLPFEIYNKRENYESDYFKFYARTNNRYIIKPIKEANLDYFSDFEIEIMNNLIQKYIRKNLSMSKITDNICNDSHKDIKAYKIAYEKEKNSEIDYSDTFTKIEKKEHDRLSIQEERYLVFRGLKKISLCD